MSANVNAGAAEVDLVLDMSQLTKGLQAADAKIAKFGKKISSTGATFLKAGAAILAPLGLAGREFATFESSMAKVNTMLGANEDAMAMFGGSIQRLSAEFGEETSVMADGLYDILSASVPAGNAIDVLRVSTQAAIGGFTDTATAADALTTVINAYGYSASEASKVSDIFFSIQKQGKTTFGQLAPVIGRVATLSASAGVSFEELGSMLALLTKNGIQTAEAVTAVRAIISTFLKPTKESAEAADELGIALNSAALKTKGLSGALGQLKGLSLAELTKLFPNVQAISGILPAVNNLEDLANIQNSISFGETEKAAIKMSATVENSFNRMVQAVKAIGVEIGASLREPMLDLLSYIRDILPYVKQWVKENKGLIVSVAGIGAALFSLGSVLVTAGGALSAIASGFSAVKGVIAALGGGAAIIKGIGVAASAAAPYLAAVGVAVAGWKFGEYISEVTGLKKAIVDLAAEAEIFGKGGVEDNRVKFLKGKIDELNSEAQSIRGGLFVDESDLARAEQLEARAKKIEGDLRNWVLHHNEFRENLRDHERAADEIGKKAKKQKEIEEDRLKVAKKNADEQARLAASKREAAQRSSSVDDVQAALDRQIQVEIDADKLEAERKKFAETLRTDPRKAADVAAKDLADEDRETSALEKAAQAAIDAARIAPGRQAIIERAGGAGATEKDLENAEQALIDERIAHANKMIQKLAAQQQIENEAHSNLMRANKAMADAAKEARGIQNGLVDSANAIRGSIKADELVAKINEFSKKAPEQFLDLLKKSRAELAKQANQAFIDADAAAKKFEQTGSEEDRKAAVDATSKANNLGNSLKATSKRILDQEQAIAESRAAAKDALAETAVGGFGARGGQFAAFLKATAQDKVLRVNERMAVTLEDMLKLQKGRQGLAFS